MFGSTSNVKSYQAWPLVKSVLGIPLSTSAGSDFVVQATPALVDCLNAFNWLPASKAA